MIKINNELLSSLSEEAKISTRLRKNYNFHEQMDDPIQRLLNALEPATYVRPHRHIDPDKDEIFFVLKGKMLLIEFNEKGAVTDHILLDPLQGNYGCEVKAGVWHSLISLESGSVAYEVKKGPFEAINEPNFAAWAPKEDPIEISKYQNYLLQQLGYSL